MKPIVVVTEREYRKAEAVFTAAAELQCVTAPQEETALAEAIRALGARHTIVPAQRYTAALYEALPPGGVLARFGVGHDGIDKVKATAAGLLCTNTPGVLNQSVAEHTLMLMLAAARDLPRAVAAAQDGSWYAAPGFELEGKRLAVIGCGPIGRAVARTAAFGFGLRVVGCDPVVRSAEGCERIATDFAEAVRGADFVSLHIPASPATAHFLNEGRLALLEPHAWVINTARGSVVDEEALAEALRTGRLGGAALDVFENEPYQPVSPAADLRQFANALLTPHIGSNTAEANRRMAESALRNVALGEARKYGEMDLLNPEVLERLDRG